MKTLDLHEAAAFLKMNPEALRQRAKTGQIPGGKPGKCWAFLEEDLAAYLRSLYAGQRQAAQERQEAICHSTNAERPGGLRSPHQAASALDKVLARKTGRKRRNSTTD